MRLFRLKAEATSDAGSCTVASGFRRKINQLSCPDADFLRMERGKAFVEVLDEVLEGYTPHEPVRPSRAGLGYATPSILFFNGHLTRSAHSFPWLPPSSPPSPWLPPSGGRTTRPRRTLSSRQRQALNAFVELGARIGDDFTDAELRSVFRSLALRYHPDRHPGSSDREKARLSTSFAQLHEAYQSLKLAPVSSN